MNVKKKRFKMVLLLAGLILVGLVVVNGCKKSEPAEAPASTPPPAEETVKAAAKVEQTICPVMAGPINKDIFVEYEGKKVYFCCPDCKEKFEAEPEKFIAKLPQFNK